MGDVVRDRRHGAELPNVRLTCGKISIKHWHVEYFFKIIDEELEDLMDYDICYKLADNYLIAMVFMYFLRADFRPAEYTRFNFFAALCLAHDMEEENDDNIAELLLFSAPTDSPSSPQTLYRHRLNLFVRMGYRAVVSRVCCESLMRITNPNHRIWRRARYAVHSGANRSYHRTRSYCPNCIGDVSSGSS